MCVAVLAEIVVEAPRRRIARSSSDGHLTRTGGQLEMKWNTFLGHNSSLLGYTGLGTIWANEELGFLGGFLVCAGQTRTAEDTEMNGVHCVSCQEGYIMDQYLTPVLCVLQ